MKNLIIRVKQKVYDRTKHEYPECFIPLNIRVVLKNGKSPSLNVLDDVIENFDYGISVKGFLSQEDAIAGSDVFFDVRAGKDKNITNAIIVSLNEEEKEHYSYELIISKFLSEFEKIFGKENVELLSVAI